MLTTKISDADATDNGFSKCVDSNLQHSSCFKPQVDNKYSHSNIACLEPHEVIKQ